MDERLGLCIVSDEKVDMQVSNQQEDGSTLGVCERVSCIHRRLEQCNGQVRFNEANKVITPVRTSIID